MLVINYININSAFPVRKKNMEGVRMDGKKL